MRNTFFTITILLCCLVSCTSPEQTDSAFVKATFDKYTVAKTAGKNELIVFVKETDSLLSSYNNSVYDGLNNFIKGSYFNGTSNFSLALTFLSKVENDLEKYPAYDSLRLASYLFLSDVNTNLGNYDESMKQALKAKEGYEKLEMPAGVYGANISMSRMFQAKGEIKKAKDLIRSNMQVADTNMKLKAMHVLANIYGEQGELDSALAIDNEVIYNKTLYPEKFVSPFLNNKALCLNEKRQFDSALYFFEQSLLIDSAQGAVHNMAANYSDMGSMYLYQNDFVKAKYYSLKALGLSKTTGKKMLTLYSYKNLYQLHKMAKDYPNAMMYGDSVTTLQKELDNVTLNSNIQELNMVYETSKKERKIQQQHDTIERNKILFSGIAAILLVTGLLIYNYYRKKKLQHQLERVKSQQENEKAIAAAEQKERLRISRDLHDNMGAYTSALIANIEKLKLKNVDAPELGKMQDNANHILGSLRETI
ncbi:MAG: tetratricopeptide repeat protein [Ginsengibacter sp.]